MMLFAFLAVGATIMPSVVPIKTVIALRRTLDVGSAEGLLPEERDLIFRAGFSAVSIRVQRSDAERPKLLEDRLEMLRTSQKVLVLNLTDVPEDLDLTHVLWSCHDKWPDRDKLVFHLRSAADVPEVREVMPRCTLILPLPKDEKDSTDILPDGNVIYAFGSLGPNIFQNQPAVSQVRGTESDLRPMFPPDLNRIRQLTGLEPAAREAMLEYGREKWTAGDVRDRLQRWVDWGRKKRRYVWWTGFGCSSGADESSRRRYYETMARAASYFELGWCLSEYTGPWAVSRGSASSRSLVPEVAAVFSTD